MLCSPKQTEKGFTAPRSHERRANSLAEDALMFTSQQAAQKRNADNQLPCEVTFQTPSDKLSCKLYRKTCEAEEMWLFTNIIHKVQTRQLDGPYIYIVFFKVNVFMNGSPHAFRQFEWKISSIWKVFNTQQIHECQCSDHDETPAADPHKLLQHRYRMSSCHLALTDPNERTLVKWPHEAGYQLSTGSRAAY